MGVAGILHADTLIPHPALLCTQRFKRLDKFEGTKFSFFYKLTFEYQVLTETNLSEPLNHKSLFHFRFEKLACFLIKYFEENSEWFATLWKISIGLLVCYVFLCLYMLLYKVVPSRFQTCFLYLSKFAWVFARHR